MNNFFLLSFLFFASQNLSAAPVVSLQLQQNNIDSIERSHSEIKVTPLPDPTAKLPSGSSEIPSRLEPLQTDSHNVQPVPIPRSNEQISPIKSNATNQPDLLQPKNGGPADQKSREVKQTKDKKTSVRSSPKKQPRTVSREPVRTPTTAESKEKQELAAYSSSINDYIKAQQSGDSAKALEILKPLWPKIVRYGDYGTMVALAYIAMQVGDESTALKASKTVADDTEDDQFYHVYVDVLMHFKLYSKAENILLKMSPTKKRDQTLASIYLIKAQKAYNDGMYPEAERLLLKVKNDLDANGLEVLAWTEYRLGKLKSANEYFKKSYSEKPSLSSAQGLVFTANRLHEYQSLLSLITQHPGPLDNLISPDVRQKIKSGWSQFSVNSDARLTILNNSSNGVADGLGLTARVEPNYRHKKGVPGEGRLSQTGVTATLTWRGPHDEAKLTAEHQRVDDGLTPVSGQNFYALWKHFGDNNWIYRLGIGRSQSGGPVKPTYVGEAGLGYFTSDYGLGLRIFRRQNEESSLAYIGKIDPKDSRHAWGRVIENGITVDAYRKWQNWNALASVTGSQLKGDGVADNTKLELYTRALHPLSNAPNLSVGPELYASHFDKNLSAFAPGHGGYFSPKSFVKLGGLASYKTNIYNWNVDILAGLGYGWNNQASADGNPLTGADPDEYPASTSSGVAYHGNVDLTYPIYRDWLLGFNLGGQKSPEYTDWRTGLFLQHHFSQ